MSEYAIGIDFGTSTSEVCVYQHGEPVPVLDSITKSPIIPSVIAINKNGEIVIGSQAESYPTPIREIKRVLGTSEKIILNDKEYRAEEIAALILKYIKKQAEIYIGSEVKDVIISVPANFDEPKRNATLEAGIIAGLNVKRLISEPTAAAIAFGHTHLESDEVMAVFDFGGGTLDVTILEMVNGILDVKATFGDPKLGGKDFDDIIIQMLIDKFEEEYPLAIISDKSRALLKSKAKIEKENLSNVTSTVCSLTNFAVVNGEPVDMDIEITREEFKFKSQDLLDRAKKVVEDTLIKADINKDQLKHVLLVGGTTYMPFIRELTCEAFGKPPMHNINPDLAVSMGCCVQAAIAMDLIEDGLIILDNSAFGLGVSCVTSMGGQLVLDAYSELMRPNQRIPFSIKKEYHLMHEQQNEVEIKIYQDHNGNAVLCEDAVATGISGTIDNIPASATGIPHAVEVDFQYDINGLVNITARIPATNQMAIIKFDAHDSRLTELQRKQALERVDELFESNPQYASRYQTLLETAQRDVDSADPEKAERLLKYIDDLKMALENNNENEAEKAANSLSDLIYDFDI